MNKGFMEGTFPVSGHRIRLFWQEILCECFWEQKL